MQVFCEIQIINGSETGIFQLIESKFPNTAIMQLVLEAKNLEMQEHCMSKSPATWITVANQLQMPKICRILGDSLLQTSNSNLRFLSNFSNVINFLMAACMVVFTKGEQVVQKTI